MIETTDLTLVVKEQKLGELVTNALEIKSFVEARLLDYTPENYIGKVEDAKKDRAELNTASKSLNAKRLELEKLFMRPFDEFKQIIKETTNAIDGASKKLAEIEKKIETIYSDIKTLDTLEDADVLKQLYLDTLDMDMAIRKSAELKAYREKLAAEAKERAEREARKAIQEQQVELAREEITAQKNEPLAGLAAAAMGEAPDVDPIEEYTMRFKDRRSVLFALRQYMTAHGIQYTKV